MLIMVAFFYSQAYAQWGSKPTPFNINTYKRASIVFASQNLKSVVSQFGHVYIVFHNDIPIEPNAIAVEFVGILPDFQSYFGTLTNQASGEFQFTYFSDKVIEYELEDRSSWAYEIALKPDELSILKNFIIEKSSGRHRYGLFHHNCAGYLVEGMSHATGKQFYANMPLFTTPEDVLRWMRHHGLLSSARFLPSQQFRARASYNKLEIQDKKALRLAMNGLPLPESPSSSLQQAASDALTYLIPREGNQSRRNAFFSLKKRVNFQRQQFTNENDPSASIGSSTLAVSANSNIPGAAIDFRPGFIGLENEQAHSIKNAESEFLSITGRVGKDFLLEKLTVFKMGTFNAEGFLRDPFTQIFSLEYNNYSEKLQKPIREGTLIFGRGWSSDSILGSISIIPFLAARVIQTYTDREVCLTPSVRIRAYHRFESSVTYLYTVDQFGRSDNGIILHQQHVLEIPFNNKSGFQAGLESLTTKEIHFNTIKISIYRNF